METHHDNSSVHHEGSDVNVRGILIFGLGLFVTAAAIHILVWLLFLYFAGREAALGATTYPLAADQQTRVPPEPRLQTNPREDLRQFREQEDAILNSYGWVDRPAGVVRIPIEDAMKLTVKRGLPARVAANATGK
jgi:hypothetical protein